MLNFRKVLESCSTQEDLINYFKLVHDEPYPETFSSLYNTLSFWKYEQFVSCPLKYKVVCIDFKGKPTDSRNALEGSALHLVIERFLKSGVKDVSWIWDNISSVYSEVLNGFKCIQWKTQDPLEDQEVAWKSTLYQVDWIMKWFNKFKVHLLPEVHPECPYKIRVLPNLIITGRVDLWTVNDENEIQIWDWKGVKSSSSPKPEQLKMYSLGLIASKHKRIKSSCFVCPLLGGELSHKFTVKDLVEYLLKLSDVVSDIDRCRSRGVYPTKPNHFCKWCGNNVDCPDYKPKKVISFRTVSAQTQSSYKQPKKSGEISWGLK